MDTNISAKNSTANSLTSNAQINPSLEHGSKAPMVVAMNSVAEKHPGEVLGEMLRKFAISVDKKIKYYTGYTQQKKNEAEVNKKSAIKKDVEHNRIETSKQELHQSANNFFSNALKQELLNTQKIVEKFEKYQNLNYDFSEKNYYVELIGAVENLAKCRDNFEKCEQFIEKNSVEVGEIEINLAKALLEKLKTATEVAKAAAKDAEKRLESDFKSGNLKPQKRRDLDSAASGVVNATVTNNETNYPGTSYFSNVVNAVAPIGNGTNFINVNISSAIIESPNLQNSVYMFLNKQGQNIGGDFNINVEMPQLPNNGTLGNFALFFRNTNGEVLEIFYETLGNPIVSQAFNETGGKVEGSFVNSLKGLNYEKNGDNTLSIKVQYDGSIFNNGTDPVNFAINVDNSEGLPILFNLPSEPINTGFNLGKNVSFVGSQNVNGTAEFYFRTNDGNNYIYKVYDDGYEKLNQVYSVPTGLTQITNGTSEDGSFNYGVLTAEDGSVSIYRNLYTKEYLAQVAAGTVDSPLSASANIGNSSFAPSAEVLNQYSFWEFYVPEGTNSSLSSINLGNLTAIENKKAVYINFEGENSNTDIILPANFSGPINVTNFEDNGVNITLVSSGGFVFALEGFSQEKFNQVFGGYSVVSTTQQASSSTTTQKPSSSTTQKASSSTPNAPSSTSKASSSTSKEASSTTPESSSSTPTQKPSSSTTEAPNSNSAGGGWSKDALYGAIGGVVGGSLLTFLVAKIIKSKKNNRVGNLAPEQGLAFTNPLYDHNQAATNYSEPSSYSEPIPSANISNVSTAEVVIVERTNETEL